MRLYQIIMKVPDDFVSDNMELKAVYDGPIDICSEGFIGDLRMVECEDNVVEDSSFPEHVQPEVIQDAEIQCEEYYSNEADELSNVGLTRYDDNFIDSESNVIDPQIY